MKLSLEFFDEKMNNPLDPTVDYDEPTPFKSIIDEFAGEISSCSCMVPFSLCGKCSLFTEEPFLFNKVSWGLLVKTFGPTSDLTEIILPCNFPPISAQFLEKFFSKRVIFILPRSNSPIHEYLRNFWNVISDWWEEEVRYFFQRLHPTWSKVVVLNHVDATHPNLSLALTILLQRGVEFPDNYYKLGRYCEMDEFIAMERPNINRLYLVEAIMFSGQSSLISRPFFRDLLPQLFNVDFDCISKDEDLQFFVDEGLIPRTGEQLQRFLDNERRYPDYIKVLVENWDPETYDAIFYHDHDQYLDSSLEFYVQVIMSGKYTFSPEQIESDIYQAAQRIIETRSQDFGTLMKPATRSEDNS